MIQVSFCYCLICTKLHLTARKKRVGVVVILVVTLIFSSCNYAMIRMDSVEKKVATQLLLSSLNILVWEKPKLLPSNVDYVSR